MIRATGTSIDAFYYSARLVAPFVRGLSTDEGYPAEFLDPLMAIDPATRVSALEANDFVARKVNRTGDVNIGLRAGRSMILGGAGVLDYAMRSAPTVRKAVEAATRYARLLSDLLYVDYEVVKHDRATVHVEVGGAAPRAVSDFAMSAWFRNHVREPLRDAPHLECWFEHAAPRDTTEYERTFAPAALRFCAPCYGFSFAGEYLDIPLSSADPALHAVLCEYAARALGQLSDRSYTSRVREIASRELLRGVPTVFTVARELRISARTLGRRLEREETTFSALLDDLRHESALRYVGRHEMPLTEVAFRLGFSHVEALHRAFKRWTGQTPGVYRQACGLVYDGRAPVSSEWPALYPRPPVAPPADALNSTL